MRLNSQAIKYLKSAIDCVDCIIGISPIRKSKDSQCITMPQQQAILFLLKALGTYIDSAARSMGLDFAKEDDKLPFFWKHMHFLRNSLTHYFNKCIVENQFSLFPPSVDKLKEMLQIFWQVKNFLNMQIDEQKLNVNLCGDKFKVFYCFHELTNLLKEDSPRNKRGSYPQKAYLLSLIEMISQLNKWLEKTGIDENSLSQLKKNDPGTYYALQNVIEIIATVTTPTEGQSLITEKTRNDYFNSETKRALRSLGLKRNTAMHETCEIMPRNLTGHLNELAKISDHLRKQLSPTCSTLGTNVGNSESTLNKQSSTSSSFNCPPAGAQQINTSMPAASVAGLTSSNIGTSSSSWSKAKTVELIKKIDNQVSDASVTSNVKHK